MKFILLIEMPAAVLIKKRMHINRLLKRISYEQPKRNVFLLEVTNKNKIKELKEAIIRDSDPKSKVSYYQIIEEND